MYQGSTPVRRGPLKDHTPNEASPWISELRGEGRNGAKGGKRSASKGEGSINNSRRGGGGMASPISGGVQSETAASRSADPSYIGCYRVRQVLQEGPLFHTLLASRSRKNKKSSTRGGEPTAANNNINNSFEQGVEEEEPPTLENQTLHTIRPYALRKLRDNPKLQAQVEREVTILKQCSTGSYAACNNLVVLDDVFYSNNHVFLVTRYNQGGDLFELLQEDNLKIAAASVEQDASNGGTAGGKKSSSTGNGNGKKRGGSGLAGFPINIVRRVIREVLLAVSFLHNELGVCHRDIKLENVFLDEDNNARLGGLGFAAAIRSAENRASSPSRSARKPPLSRELQDSTAQQLTPDGYQLLRNFCGSKHYVCPEITREEPYDGRLADAWSIGVLTFALATGSLPFFERDSDDSPDRSAGGEGADDQQHQLLSVWEQIQHSDLHLSNHEEWRHRPWKADNPLSIRNFIMKLLSSDPTHRMTPTEALQHPFISEDGGTATLFQSIYSDPLGEGDDDEDWTQQQQGYTAGSTGSGVSPIWNQQQQSVPPPVSSTSRPVSGAHGFLPQDDLQKKKRR